MIWLNVNINIYLISREHWFFHSNLSHSLWNFALLNATHLINYIPTPYLKNMPPFQKLTWSPMWYFYTKSFWVSMLHYHKHFPMWETQFESSPIHHLRPPTHTRLPYNLQPIIFSFLAMPLLRSFSISLPATQQYSS